LLDEYGDERWDALDKEVDVVIKKIAQDEARSDGEYPPEYAGLSEFLKQSFRERFNKKLERPTLHGNFSAMTGQDFEAYLMKLLHRLGYTDISGTPVTGDQGADVLATKDGKRIVIQAKNYREPVGNAAVQEVSAAVSFYSGDEGWVVTGSTFTSAAKQLARRCNIRLIDRFDLEKMVADANT
jgi:restriction system protein